MLTSNECSGEPFRGCVMRRRNFRRATTNEVIVRRSFCGFRNDFNRTASHRHLTKVFSLPVDDSERCSLSRSMSNTFAVDYQSTSLAMHQKNVCSTNAIKAQSMCNIIFNGVVQNEIKWKIISHKCWTLSPLVVTRTTCRKNPKSGFRPSLRLAISRREMSIHSKCFSKGWAVMSSEPLLKRRSQ